MALRWKDVLKVARTDPEGFWDEGGWDAYLSAGGGSVRTALKHSRDVVTKFFTVEC